MKKVQGCTILIVLVVLVTSISICYADHTQAKLGMSIEEVEQISGRLFFDSYDFKVLNWTQTIGKYETVMYLYAQDDILVRKQCSFMEKDNTRNMSLFKAYKKKYGKPIVDSNTWNNKTKIPKDIITLVCLAIYGDDDPYEWKLIKEQVAEGNRSFMIWEPDEETLIILNNDFGSMFIEYIWQPYLFNISTDGI